MVSRSPTHFYPTDDDDDEEEEGTDLSLLQLLQSGPRWSSTMFGSQIKRPGRYHCVHAWWLLPRRTGFGIRMSPPLFTWDVFAKSPAS
jgi:hypothetical protein